jgi:NAD(P)-dependent dehydrogenase (short-subunit alcohol dehydrogenase family)
VEHEKLQKSEAPGESFYYLQQTKSAADVLNAIRKVGVDAHAWEGDLSNPDLVPEMFDQAEHFLGPVDILANNAAHWEADSFVPLRSES